MTDDFAIFTDGGATLRLEREVRGPIERVWDYLIKAELREQWISDNAMPETVGGSYSVTWDDGEGGTAGITFTVRAIEPPHVLEFMWTDLASVGGVPNDSIVRFELAAKPNDRVQVILTHRLVPATERPSIGAGWHSHLDRLRAVLDGNPGPTADERYAEIAPHYETAEAAS